MRDSFREVRVKIAAINAFLQEHITGMSVVQLFNREARAYREFEDINAAHRDANIRGIFYYADLLPGVGAAHGARHRPDPLVRRRPGDAPAVTSSAR